MLDRLDLFHHLVDVVAHLKQGFYKKDIYKRITTLLLMLETAPLHDCSSLLLLEIADVDPAAAISISSELFLVSAGLHEAETVVLKKKIFCQKKLL